MTKIDKNSLKQTYAEMNNSLAELKKQIAEKSQEYIKVIFEDFADKYEFYSVSWTQYTPYFMDGDECVFSVRELCLHFTEESEDESSYESDSDIITSLADFRTRIKNEDYGWYKTRERCEERIAECLTSLGVDKEPTPEMYAAAEGFEALKREVGNIGEEFMEMAFGDHVRVFFRKEDRKFQVDEYDHD